MTDRPGPTTQTSPETPAAPAAGVLVATTSAVSPIFKLVFLTVLGLTLAALCIDVAVATMITKPNDQTKSLFDTCLNIVWAGFGAIVGLIGGKAA